MKKLLTLIALGCCAACTPTVQPTYRDLDGISREFQRENTDTCAIAQHVHLIGQPAASIDRATLPPRARILAPDTIVTQDFLATRLNVMTDADGAVTELRCF